MLQAALLSSRRVTNNEAVNLYSSVGSTHMAQALDLLC
jgi:hypothetical protein